MDGVHEPPAPTGQAHEQELFDAARFVQLSHELRTPLTVILGYIELLQIANPREDQRQGLDAVLRAGASLSATVEGLLEAAIGQIAPESLITALYVESPKVEARAGDDAQAPPWLGLGGPLSWAAGPLRQAGPGLTTEVTAVSLAPDPTSARLGALAREVARVRDGEPPGTGGPTSPRLRGDLKLLAALDRALQVDDPPLLAMVEMQREALAGLQRAANTDHLTGIGNRRAITERVESLSLIHI